MPIKNLDKNKNGAVKPMNKTNDFENMSMFDSGETEQISINQNNTASKLEVVKAEFMEIQTLTWEELFDGFDKLYAVTYSSSVDFIVFSI